MFEMNFLFFLKKLSPSVNLAAKIVLKACQFILCRVFIESPAGSYIYHSNVKFEENT